MLLGSYFLVYQVIRIGTNTKCIYPQESIYSVRIGLSYRAVGLYEGDTIIWYWIGSHADYDHL